MTARSTVDTRKLDPTSIIVFHQAYVPFPQVYFYSLINNKTLRDVGEYLRDEVSHQKLTLMNVLLIVYTGDSLLMITDEWIPSAWL